MQEWYECSLYDRHPGQAPESIPLDDPDYLESRQRNGHPSWEDVDVDVVGDSSYDK